MNANEIQELINETVTFPEYTFEIIDMGTMYLQGSYEEFDYHKKKMSTQKTRKWLLSQYMTKSEVIQTVFKCCLTSYEHRCREAFKYKNKRVFGPHFDVDSLHGICKDEHLDYRKDNDTPAINERSISFASI